MARQQDCRSDVSIEVNELSALSTGKPSLHASRRCCISYDSKEQYTPMFWLGQA